MHTTNMSIDVRDHIRTTGGQELIKYLTHLAKKRGLLEFTAEVLIGNQPIFHATRWDGFDVQKRNEFGCTRLG